MRWCLVLEEFGPELIYIKGKHNIVADALSPLETDDKCKIFRTPNTSASMTKAYLLQCFHYAIAI
jgi:hypothetical protein